MSHCSPHDGSISDAGMSRTALGGVISNRKEANPQQLLWFRSRAKVTNDPAFQKCVIAYASDLSFIGTAAAAAGLGGRTTPSLGMLASLDHALYFYDDTVDASDWLLFYVCFDHSILRTLLYWLTASELKLTDGIANCSTRSWSSQWKDL